MAKRIGTMPGGNVLAYIIAPVLPVLNRQIRGISAYILLSVVTLTMAIGATSLVLNRTVVAVSMNTKAS